MRKIEASGWHVYVLALGLVLTLVLGLVFLSYQRRCHDRIRAVRVNLAAIRSSIQEYSRLQGCYPKSFRGLREFYIAHGKEYWEKAYVDLTSEKKSNIPEYRELNGKGGYFYDPNSGEIRLNLTRPVKAYLPWYRGPLGQEIPAQW